MPHWVDPVPALKRQVAEQVVILTADFSQSWAAAWMHLSQARVSELRRGNLENVSLERLVQCLSYLARETVITTVRNGRGKGLPHRKIVGEGGVCPGKRICKTE